ncbi:hypothetical protein DSL72_005866 [Monilinia vaccinii-corymbosi]|uniref:Uncharacterized protein n=1 Tax=Monilinia vaccinii-corymbosi TaxID=61207 RepID=A0A8A3PH15_9HELO|nr:hypothetical protein DSL72_005866 [Monilinia vaccinii-corymbosi]
MPGLLSTLRNGYQAVSTSFQSTLSTVKKWFRREVTPILQDITFTVQLLYNYYGCPFVIRLFRFIKTHPLELAIGLLAIMTIIYPGIITLPFLFVLGFMSMGPAAGSLAAFIQAIIGNVTVNGLFAIFQSAGMLGYGLVLLNSFVVAGAVLVLVLLMVYLIVESRRRRRSQSGY